MTSKTVAPISVRSSSGPLNGFWLWLVRILWIGLVIVSILPNILSIPAYYRELAGNPQVYSFESIGDFRDWQPVDLHRAAASLGLPINVVAVMAVVFSLINVVIFLAVALIIFWSKSNTWLGLLSSFILASLGTGLAGLPGDLSGIPILSVMIRIGGFIWPFFFIFLLIYPTGKFEPAWVRYLGFMWIALFFVSPFLPQTVMDRSQFIFVVMMIASLVLPFYRYLHSASPIERLQMRWFAFSLVIFMVFWVPGFPTVHLPQTLFPVITAYSGPRLAYEIIYGQMLRLLVNALLPISIALAIFRYHLWEIDLIIRRTLIYGALTAVLALFYYGSITLLQSLLTKVTGQQSPIALVASTLAIVVLFSPLRRWIQAVVDRAFYRRKYDSANALDKFSQTARNVVELNDLANHLAAVVIETVQPVSVNLWLAPHLASSPKVDKQ